MADNFKEKFIITSQYIPAPSRRRSGILADKIKFVVVHDTGNPGSTAKGNVGFYISTCETVEKKKTASAHLFVDDKEIIECVPALTGTPEKAWHVLYDRPKDNELFGADANDAAIGVEYCFGGRIDPDLAYQKYIWVVAKLCFVFKLDPSRSIVGHFFLDPGRKTDPVTGLLQSRRTYDQLLIDIQNEYLDCTGSPVDTAFRETAKTGTAITLAKLNMRTEPSRTSRKIQVVPLGTTLSYVAVVENGEKINNNPVWYKSSSGQFFWSGGIRLT